MAMPPIGSRIRHLFMAVIMGMTVCAPDRSP
jgi:hypothetical protein